MPTSVEGPDASDDLALAPFVAGGSADVVVGSVVAPLGPPLVSSPWVLAAVGGATGDVGGSVVAARRAVALGAVASSGVAGVPVVTRPTRTTMAARATTQMPNFSRDFLRFGICAFGRSGLGPTIAGSWATSRYAGQTTVEEWVNFALRSPSRTGAAQLRARAARGMGLSGRGEARTGPPIE